MTIPELFRRFEGLTALIVGDVMLDAYVWGKVTRISPEAPVPIVNVQRTERRLGGAANVALNVRALGGRPILCSLIGQDAEADSLLALARERGIGTEGLVPSAERPTTIKHRVMAASQQLLRIDAEEDRPASPAETESLLERVRALITQADVVIFEDYDKGALTPESIAAIVSMARSRGIPTVVDPKKRNFLAYSGCSLFKPNLKELKEGLKLEFDARDPRQLGQAVRQLCEAMPIGAALITLSEWGVYATDFTEEHHIPAHKREIADVSGAGDTVVSIASLCLAAGEGLARAAALANLGGGLVCEHLGVVPVSKERLLQEALRL